MKLIESIKRAGIVGRGGAEFPTAAKWEMVKKAKGKPKYVICNASEGELGTFKDFHILDKFPEKVFRGMALAMDYLGTKEAWFNLNANYYKKLKKKLDALILKWKKKGYCFHIYQEHPSYIGGEETALLEGMEGKRVQPRLKPPYPGERGLFGQPTLINNVETFYDVADVAAGTFEKKRFYSFSGHVKHAGVFHLPIGISLMQALKMTDNVPDSDYFVQVGGSASGVVLNKTQLKTNKMTGAGSIEVFPASLKPRDLLLKWFRFYRDESCGKCTPCREGTFHLYELVKKHDRVPWGAVLGIVEAMEKISFCGLGRSIGLPVKSYMQNILNLKTK
ncbi:MAG: NADH-ubiquinone oxidoreductase-F iron-sulfur binding region domain-containing protein [Candidatus Peregrinibacteria bacterium]